MKPIASKKRLHIAFPIMYHEPRAPERSELLDRFGRYVGERLLRLWLVRTSQDFLDLGFIKDGA
jgi:hypothetical protein